ncbi:NAD(P)/FAD-dependent oxidoreductase [Agrobacterium tumefaciens]|nr:FAD-binding oxidoreductase [Agrobacterium tumefaciens]
MDVIVLGGGLMGTASAYFLARRGVRVTLVERNRVGSGATVASFGNIRRSGRYLPQLPLACRSLTLWAKTTQMLGRDIEFRATGHIRLAFSDRGLEEMRNFSAAARPWGLELEELTAKDLHGRFPGLGPQAIAASFSPEDGSGNPRLVAPAFADAARRIGAEIVENVEVRAVRKTAYGFEVETTDGTHSGSKLLNTAGAWGARLAAEFGERVPISARGPQMGVTEPLPHRILPVVGVWAHDHGGGYLRQVERGNIVFGGAAERTEVSLDDGRAKADPARLPGQLRALLPILPALANVSVIRTWSGCEGYVEDGLPVICASNTVDGLFHAFGFCGHGFQLGPGVGDVMADLIATGTTETPIDDFHIDRFASGVKS